MKLIRRKYISISEVISLSYIDFSRWLKTGFSQEFFLPSKENSPVKLDVYGKEAQTSLLAEPDPMFVEGWVGSSAQFTLLVGWHASLPPGDVILAQLAIPLNDVIFVYIGNNQPILYKHWPDPDGEKLRECKPNEPKFWRQKPERTS